MATDGKIASLSVHMENQDVPKHEIYESNSRDDQVFYLDTTGTKNEALKAMAGGCVLLIPQPSESPQDPFNWSPMKKHVLLAVVVVCSFLPDYGSVAGAATLTLQAE